MRRDSFEMPQRTIIDSPRPSRSRSLHKTTSDGSIPGRQVNQASVTGGGSVRWNQSSAQQHEPGRGGYNFRQASFDMGHPRQIVHVPSEPLFQQGHPHHHHHHHHRQASLGEGVIPRPGQGMSESQHSVLTGDMGYHYSHQHFLDSHQPASFHDMRGPASVSITHDPSTGHAFHKYASEQRKCSLTDFRHGPVQVGAENLYRKGSVSDDSSSHYSAESGPISLMYIKTDSTGSDAFPGHEHLYSADLRGREEYLAFSQDIASQQGRVSPVLQPTGAVTGKSKRSFPRTNPNYTGLSRPSEGQLPGSSGIYRKISAVDSHQSLGGSSAGYDSMVGDGGSAASVSIQTSQSLSDTYSDPHSSSGNIHHQTLPYHSRSDSDASQSGTSRSRHVYRGEQQRFDGGQMRGQDLACSHSSQGSARNVSDIHSSHGSLRSLQETARSDGKGKSKYYF